jgi:hypothetical protein
MNHVELVLFVSFVDVLVAMIVVTDQTMEVGKFKGRELPRENAGSA